MTEASNSIMNWRLGSGWDRIGVGVNRDFRHLNAAMTSSDHWKSSRVDVRLVGGQPP